MCLRGEYLSFLDISLFSDLHLSSAANYRLRLVPIPVDPMQLILASSSPRRRELLSRAGFVFSVVNPQFCEESSSTPDQSAPERARTLALAKAHSVAANFEDALVLGADTVVALEDRIIGKPRDHQHARRILTALSGSTHQVITALALIFIPSGRTLLEHDTTSLTMAQLGPDQIDHYLCTGPWHR